MVALLGVVLVVVVLCSKVVKKSLLPKLLRVRWCSPTQASQNHCAYVIAQPNLRKIRFLSLTPSVLGYYAG